VFQQFAHVDLISGGRAEIMAGRGSFIESFPLFGYDLDDYDRLFTEKLELLLALRDGGRARDQPVYPRPVQEPLPIWIAVGGTPQSVARAGYLGLPLALAIIGGEPERFAPMVELYREAARQGGHDAEALPVSINSHTFVADTTQQAADTFYGPYSAVMTRIGRERGWSPMTRGQFDAALGLHQHLVVGDVEAVVEKIVFQHSIFGHSRFLAQMSLGAMPHDAVLRSIELFGTEVAPRVRAAIGERVPA
jgi:alkanesulfonate monooxygenase SsuD/methylene tetrahydromethanopterin reductase-like flavin-dependent oxidoreductase (luciferase family)